MASPKRAQTAAQVEAEARLNQLLDELSGYLKATIRRICPRTVGIHGDEIEQEVRIRLWRSLDDERIISSPPSYIRRIAVTAVIDAVRRIKARREEPLPSLEEETVQRPHALRASESPLDVVEANETRRIVEQGLARLESSRRRAVRLHLQGFGLKEIADLLGWTEPKARNLVYRGLADLRRELRASGLDLEAE